MANEGILCVLSLFMEPHGTGRDGELACQMGLGMLSSCEVGCLVPDVGSGVMGVGVWVMWRRQDFKRLSFLEACVHPKHGRDILNSVVAHITDA